MISQRSHRFWHGHITWLPGYQGDWAGFPKGWECCSLCIRSQEWAWFSSQLQRFGLKHIAIGLCFCPWKDHTESSVGHPSPGGNGATAQKGSMIFFSEEPETSPLVAFMYFKLLLGLFLICSPGSLCISDLAKTHWVRKCHQGHRGWAGQPWALMLRSGQCTTLQLKGGRAGDLRALSEPVTALWQSFLGNPPKGPHPKGLFCCLHSAASYKWLSISCTAI